MITCLECGTIFGCRRAAEEHHNQTNHVWSGRLTDEQVAVWREHRDLFRSNSTGTTGNAGIGQTELTILKVLSENGGEVLGVFHLGHRLIGCNDLRWLRTKLQALVTANAITIKDNGNGRPKVIKRNRNSPGYPRRRS